MRVIDVLNEKTAKIKGDASLREAAELLATTLSSDLMVVDENDLLLGVLSEGDLVRAVMPTEEEVLEGDFPLLQSLELIEEKGVNVGRLSVKDVMIEAPVTVSPEDPLLKAAQIMTSKMIRRLPVVDDGKLVGSLSRADICLHVLKEQA